MDPNALRYALTHEWAKFDGDLVTVGITQFAAEQLGDLTALQLPKVGTAVRVAKPFGEIESVKSVSDLYAPVSGTVVEVNTKLADNPEPIQTDAFGQWLIRIKMDADAQTDHLMSKAEYDAQIASA